MLAYRRLEAFVVVTLGLELVVGLAGSLTPRGEIFPFASWFLFSLVPDRVVSYDVILHGTDARPLTTPKPFNQSGPLVHSPHSVVEYQVIQQLGRAIESGSPKDIARWRREIEEQFTSAGMRYDVTRVSYRLGERWRGEQSPRSATLVSFRAGEGDALP